MESAAVEVRVIRVGFGLEGGGRSSMAVEIGKRFENYSLAWGLLKRLAQVHTQRE